MLFHRMPLCATKLTRRLSWLASALIGVALPLSLAGQQVPQRPSNVTDQQLQQYVQQPGMGAQIQQAIQQSGLTPDQIRARLRSAGYPDNLIDQYLTPKTAGQAAPAPSVQMLQAVSALGIGQFIAPSDTLGARRDSILLMRGDSLLLDSLGFQLGVDSIPTKRDSLGFLRLDSLATFRLADRIHRSRVFGLDVFRNTTTQFNPMLSGPVSPDYSVGPGDELVLILTGDVELAYQLPVTRDGFIVIPQVGQIYVANLTLAQLQDLLYARLGRVYSGVKRGAAATTHFEITVSRVRVNQVYVTGEVARPGAYSVSALGTVMNALYQAGGPTERGDFRQVRITRNGQVVDTLDLYDYLLYGNTRGDIRLQQGDVVFVPPRSRRVQITGSIARPALYDLAPGQDLRELVQMAGGLLPEAYMGRAQVERVLPPDQRQPGGHDRTVIDVDIRAVLAKSAPPFHLDPDDGITIFRVSAPVRDRVVIRGDVWHPGAYQIDSGMTLSRLIAAAGGLKPDVYAERAQIMRLNPDSTRQLLPVSLVGIPPQGAPGAGGDSESASQWPPTGHLAYDPTLQEFDEVTVFSRTEFRPLRQVAVFGSVQHPGMLAFTDSMTLRDAVMMAGGLRDDAYLLDAEISRIPEVQRGGEIAQVVSVPLDSSYVLDATAYVRRPTGPRTPSPRLEPYDNVFIRQVPGWELQRNVVVSGEVRFPGRYTLLTRDDRLRDVISRAGGLTPTAYVQGAQFFRAEGRAGRIGLDLGDVMKDPTFRDNFILFTGDSLYVPRYLATVSVEGGVNSPVAVAYVPRQGTGYYIDRAGGFARRADKGRTYVVQPNGAVEKRSATPEPGARVVVPEVPVGEDRTNWPQIVTTFGTLLASLLSILVLSKQL